MSSTSNSFDLPASEAGSDAKKAREFKVIALIAVAHFVSHVHIMLLPPIFGQVKDAFGVSYIEVGFALTAFNAMRERLADPTLPPRSILLPPRLVVRESCGAYK